MHDFKKFLDDDALYFDFQPVVSAADASILGYEALVRSNISGLETPYDIITTATDAALLNSLEVKIMTEVLKCCQEQKEKLVGKWMFFNSLPSERPDDSIYKEILDKYAKDIPNLVIEVSECEQHSQATVDAKGKFVTENGGQIAFDNYGAGFNSEESIFQFSPNFIKIDFCITLYIDQSQECRDFLRVFVEEAHKNEVKVIAMGIETHSQMAECIKLGVDYLQGYYLARPSQDMLPSIDESRAKEIIELAKN